MKSVHIVYPETVHDELLQLMKKIGVGAYSILPEVFGRGYSTEPRFNNHIWPGKNQMMLIVCDDGSAEVILEKLELLREQFPHEGILGYSFVIDAITQHTVKSPLKGDK